MTGSKLKPNPSKTEFLLIGTKLQREKFLNNFPCLLLGQDTNPFTSTKNLGVLFDSSLNFRKHISQTCRACFYHIRDLHRIRKSLTLDFVKQIAVALVSSKLDYCNSLFHNMPEKDIARLQTRSKLPCKSSNQGPTIDSFRSNSKTITLASCQVSPSF